MLSGLGGNGRKVCLIGVVTGALDMEENQVNYGGAQERDSSTSYSTKLLPESVRIIMT